MLLQIRYGDGIPEEVTFALEESSAQGEELQAHEPEHRAGRRQRA